MEEFVNSFVKAGCVNTEIVYRKLRETAEIILVNFVPV